MVTRSSGRAGRRTWRGAALAFVAAVSVVTVVGVAAGRAMAAEDDDTPQLWEPQQAVAFLLGTPGSKPEGDDQGARPWDGALGAGITLALFGTYRVVLSSQDLPVCGFAPSCSRFSQRVIDRCGPLQGALLSLDRLLRDHPLALSFYPRGADGRLKDDPDRYCLTAPE